MKQETNMGKFRKKSFYSEKLSIREVDYLLSTLPKGELLAYRASLEFYRASLEEEAKQIDRYFIDVDSVSASLTSNRQI